MKIALLPFNAGPGTEPAFARQTSGFVGEVVSQVSEAEINPVSYMGRTEENGMPKFAHINPSEELNEAKLIADYFGQSDTEKLIDGLLVEQESGGGTLTVRWYERDNEEPIQKKEYSYLPGGMLGSLREFVLDLLADVGGELTEDLKSDTGLFGTEDEKAFRNFLLGYDATQYVERSQGMVLSTFDPEPALKALISAVEADRDWEGPYLAAIELCRLCTQYQLGNAQLLEGTLRKLTDLESDDARGWFALGNLYQMVGDHQNATTAFEKAHTADPKEPAILTRLGQSQVALKMPVNAERSFRKAVEMEGDDKPSMDFLANILVQTGRGHEVPDLWKEVISSSPQNPHARAKLAMSFVALKKEDEAEAEFEKAIVELEEPLIAKRYYAPYLAQKEKFDKAMDLYEDVLDAAPTEVQVMSEYAQTLNAAGREFEVPKVLRDILAANPDQNTKALTASWLIELEQPQRAEIVQKATERAEKSDFKGALDELTPLKTWLADYWKLWAVMSSIHNQLNQFEDAEMCARKTLEMYPACEPAYGELCTALSGLDREGEAYSLMKQALSNMPNSLLIAVNYAMAAKRAGDTEEAKKVAAQIRELTGNAENLQQVLAEIES